MNYSRLTAMAESSRARHAAAQPQQLLHRLAALAARTEDPAGGLLRIRRRRARTVSQPGAVPRSHTCDAGDTASA